MLALVSGLRLGELLGLRWSDIDLDQRRLFVTQNIVWVHGHAHRGAPKTRRSRRSVPLVAFAVTALRAHSKRQAKVRLAAGPLWNDFDLVFSNAVGKPLNSSTFRTRSFLPLIEKAQVHRIRFQDIRGTTASLLYALGADDRLVQELLGHTSVKTTHDHYIHTRDRAQENPQLRAAVDRLGAILERAADGSADGNEHTRGGTA